MKIVFICSSLESGRDGVGDYVTRLAVELTTLGNQVTTIAINDRFIEAFSTEMKTVEDAVLQIVRIPNTASHQFRLKRVFDYIKGFNPDWISFQYVGYGFNNYGLPFKTMLLIRRITKTAKLHLMFHELWCGMAADAEVKEKLLGIVQKRFVKLMVSYLEAECVFTSISPYAIALRRLGVRAKVVPIFSNIPLNCSKNDLAWDELIETKGMTSLCREPEKWLIAGFFGSIYPFDQLEELLANLQMAAAQRDLKLGIISTGSNRGTDVGAIAGKLKNVSFWQTGPQPATLVDRILKMANIAIVTTPADGFDKSGTAIAWAERGIPVLVSNTDESYWPSEMEPRGIFQARLASDIWKAVDSRGYIPATDRLKHVAQLYLHKGFAE